MMWSIKQVWSTPKTKLSYRDRLDRVSFVMKTKQENDVIDRIGAVYAKNDNELLSSIKSGADSDENQRGKQCD